MSCECKADQKWKVLSKQNAYYFKTLKTYKASG